MINNSTNIFFDQFFFSSSLHRTVSIGHNLGLGIMSGMAITLSGDFGTGKTSFTKGLARGLGVTNTKYVNSPSYSLINQYMGRFIVYHVDLCRIDSTEDLEEIGFMDLFNSNAVVIVEWPEIIELDDLPIKHIKIKFEMISEFERSIRIVFKKSTLNLENFLLLERISLNFRRPGLLKRQ